MFSMYPYLTQTVSLVYLWFKSKVTPTSVKSDGSRHSTGLLIGCVNFEGFQRQIRGIFEANLAEKRSVENGRFRENFLGKIR